MHAWKKEVKEINDAKSAGFAPNKDEMCGEHSDGSSAILNAVIASNHSTAQKSGAGLLSAHDSDESVYGFQGSSSRELAFEFLHVGFDIELFVAAV
jgi:hypothetical protein